MTAVELKKKVKHGGVEEEGQQAESLEAQAESQEA
jgi:hypothetical protein